MAIKLNPSNLFAASITSNRNRTGYVSDNFLKSTPPRVNNNVTPNVVTTTLIANEVTDLGHSSTNIDAIGNVFVTNDTVNITTITLDPGTLFDVNFQNTNGYSENFLTPTDPRVINNLPRIDFVGEPIGGNINGGTGTISRIDTVNGISGGPITSAGTIGLTGQALMFHLLNGTGLVTRNSDGEIVARVIQGAANQITVTNGTGDNGNPVISISPNPIIPGTGAIILPSGPTSDRPEEEIDGMLRYNRTLATYEFYNGSEWIIFTDNTVYEFIFNNTTDWAGPTNELFTYTIPNTAHNKSSKVQVQVYELILGEFEQVRPDRIAISTIGDVYIRSSEKFAGKVIMS